MLSEDLQNCLNDTKIEITIGNLSTFNKIYDPKEAWKLIKVGQCYWFYNYDFTKGPSDFMKIKITYKRSGVYFFKVLDKRYKTEGKEEYADMDTLFTKHLYPAVYKNPNPEYLKPENFDTLDGRIKIV